ncbi:MAG: 3'-5' exonuclease, partial [Solirubrobacteraceae bacterium]
WRDERWCAVDLELTGLDPRRDEIIAIGAVPIDDGRVLLGGAYYSLVRPGRAPGRGSVLIHKLREADLTGAPALDRALDGLLAVLAGRVPVFHTAWVEEAFLGRALRRRGVRLPAGADTDVLGRRWLAARGEAASGHITLSGLATRLGFIAETPHHALGDALTTAQAFITLAALLDGASPQTVGSLIAGASAATLRAAGGARRLGPVG